MPKKNGRRQGVEEKEGDETHWSYGGSLWGLGFGLRREFRAGDQDWKLRIGVRVEVGIRTELSVLSDSA